MFLFPALLLLPFSALLPLLLLSVPFVGRFFPTRRITLISIMTNIVTLSLLLILRLLDHHLPHHLTHQLQHIPMCSNTILPSLLPPQQRDPPRTIRPGQHMTLNPVPIELKRPHRLIQRPLPGSDAVRCLHKLHHLLLKLSVPLRELGLRFRLSVKQCLDGVLRRCNVGHDGNALALTLGYCFTKLRQKRQMCVNVATMLWLLMF